MNKSVYGVILLFSLFSTIAVFMAIFIWAFNNDYVLYEVNVQAENLKDLNLISQYDVDQIEAAGNEHAALDLHFDDWWFGSFIVMVIMVLTISYFSREEGIYSFLNMLFFGSMVFLFALTFVDQINEYLLEEIFYKMLPVIQGNMPKYEFYMEHVGIISFLIFVASGLLNRFYFKIKEFTKKKDISDLEEVF